MIGDPFVYPRFVHPSFLLIAQGSSSASSLDERNPPSSRQLTLESILDLVGLAHEWTKTRVMVVTHCSLAAVVPTALSFIQHHTTAYVTY